MVVEPERRYVPTMTEWERKRLARQRAARKAYQRQKRLPPMTLEEQQSCKPRGRRRLEA